MSLSHDENWGERYVTSRAVGQMAGEFLSLGWFIENMFIGEMAAEFSKVMQEKLALSGESPAEH